MAKPKTYRVRENFFVHLDEQKVLKGGDEVELDEETARAHFHKLEEILTDKQLDKRLSDEEAERQRLDEERYQREREGLSPEQLAQANADAEAAEQAAGAAQ